MKKEQILDTFVAEVTKEEYFKEATKNLDEYNKMVIINVIRASFWKGVEAQCHSTLNNYGNN